MTGHDCHPSCNAPPDEYTIEAPGITITLTEPEARAVLASLKRAFGEDDGALERQLEAAQEFQLELQARLDLQTEEARRANERARRAEVRASGAHTGYDC